MKDEPVVELSSLIFSVKCSQSDAQKIYCRLAWLFDVEWTSGDDGHEIFVTCDADPRFDEEYFKTRIMELVG